VTLAHAKPRSQLPILLLLIAAGTTHCVPYNWNDESRMATIQSLVESRTLAIDQSAFSDTGDKVFVNGHFYSDKPPVPALIGAAIYAPLYAAGLRLHKGYTAAYYLITLMTVSMAWVFGTLALYSALRFTGLEPQRRTLCALALGLGSLFLTWSSTFNNHAIAAGCLSIGFMYLLRGRFEGGARNFALSGLFMAIAAASDVPTSVFYLLFAGYVIISKELRRHFAFFVLPILATLIPTALVDLAIHGSVMPVQIYRQYFEYPGSPWIGSDELSGMKVHHMGFILHYAFRSLFGPAGFVLYNPFIFVALFGCWRVLKRHEQFWPECLCVLAGSLILCCYYWLTTSNYGGRSYSIRWFVPTLPLLFFFLYPYALSMNLRRRQAFIAILAVSTVISLVGVLNPWSVLAQSDIAFVENIRGYFEHLPPGWTM
jgi:hypothetical protein